MNTKVQIVTNELWNRLMTKAETDSICKAQTRQMRNGYSLGFPAAKLNGSIHLGICLIAKPDWRVRMLESVTTDSDATYVAIFRLFADEAAWTEDCSKVVALFSQQPGMKPIVVT